MGQSSASSEASEHKGFVTVKHPPADALEEETQAEFRRLAALGTNGPDALESMLGRLSDPRAQKQVKKLVQELSQKLS